MQSSKEKNKSTKSGYAVFESIMPSLIARVPAARVEKHQYEQAKRVYDVNSENNAGLPCFWNEERDGMCERKSFEVTSRNQMASRPSAWKDSSQTHKPGIQREDPVLAKRKHDHKVVNDFKKDAVLLESRGIQPSLPHKSFSREVMKEKKQVKFKPPPESTITPDNDIATSKQALNVPENVVDDVDNFIETNTMSQSSGLFDVHSCKWKKPYDPSEYMEIIDLSEKHIDSAEQVDSTIFQWSKKYDPLKFKDKEEPGSVRSVPPLDIGSDADGDVAVESGERERFLRQSTLWEQPSLHPLKTPSRGFSPDIPVSLRSHPGQSGDGCGDGEREARRMGCEHGGIPRDFQNRRIETPERGDFNEINQVELEEKMKSLLGEIAAAEKSPKNHQKKKHRPKDSKKKSKSRYPIDEYLNLIQKREEHFSLPSVSPPPPSPSAKVMQRAEDLLQAAEYYLSNIKSDLSLGSRTPSGPSPRTEDSSSLCSSLSEEINPLLIRKAVNEALGDIEAKVKNQVHFSAKSYFDLSHERAKTFTSRSTIPKTAQGIIPIPSDEHVDIFEQPGLIKSISQSAKSNPASDLNKTKKSIDRAYELAEEVNSNFTRMNALRKNLLRPQKSETQMIKSMNPPKSPLVSKIKPQMSSASSLDRVVFGAMAPSNTPKVSKDSIIKEGPQLIDGIMRNERYLSKNSNKNPPNREEPANHIHKEDESVTSEIMSETTDSGASPKSVNRIIKVNSKPKQKSTDVGVNTSYSLLFEVMDAFTEEVLNENSICMQKSTRSVKCSMEKPNEGHAGRLPSCPKHSKVTDKGEDISKSPKKENCATESSNTTQLPAKNQVIPDPPLNNTSDITPANTVGPLVEHVEKKIEENIIVDNLTNEVAPESENGHVSKENLVTGLNIAKKENTTVQTDFPTLAEVLENILINEVRKVTEEAQKSPSRQRENAERLEKSISEILDELETPPESAELSEEKVLSPIQEQLTPLPSEEAIQKLIQLEEQVERICTPATSPLPGHLHIELSEQEFHLTTVNTPSLSPLLHLHKDELEGDTFQEIETPCSTPEEVISTPEASPRRERCQVSPTSLQTPSPTPRGLVKAAIPDIIQRNEATPIPSSKHLCMKDQATSFEEQLSDDQSHSSAKETLPSDGPALFIPELKKNSPSDGFRSTGTSRTTTSRDLETLRKEVMKAIINAGSTTVPSFLVSERSNISDYDIKELASAAEQQMSDIRTKTNISSPLSSTSKLSSVDEPSPPSQIKNLAINDSAASNNFPPQKTILIPEEGQMHEKSIDKDFNALQSSSVHQERLQNSDLTTATSISMEPADNLSFMDDEPHRSFSEGEVKIKHSSIQTTNSDLISEGEIPGVRYVAACHSSSEFNRTKGNQHVSLSGMGSENLLHSWSEGEVRNRWVLIQAHGSTSTSTNDSKSQGEVSPLVLGSIRSEGEVTIEDSYQSGKRV